MGLQNLSLLDEDNAAQPDKKGFRRARLAETLLNPSLHRIPDEMKCIERPKKSLS
jgi:hypothetical protein